MRDRLNRLDRGVGISMKSCELGLLYHASANLPAWGERESLQLG